MSKTTPLPTNPAAMPAASDRATDDARSTPRAGQPTVRQMWFLFWIGAAVSAGLMVAAGLTVDPGSPSNLPFIAAVSVVLILRTDFIQRRLRHGRVVADIAGYYLTFAALALLGAVTSYPIAGLSHGFADSTLQRIDVALHFDWLAWYRLVVDHRALQLLGIAAYQSIYLIPAILLGWFAVHGDRENARRFLASFWLAAVVTLAMFALMPAVGPLSYLWQGPVPYLPSSELWQPDLIPELRQRTIQVVDLGQLRGLVSAPSFHAVAATLYGVTAWRIARLRWPLLALCGAMLLSTPIEGTHYLSDILLGIVVAIGVIATTDAVFRRHAPISATRGRDAGGYVTT